MHSFLDLHKRRFTISDTFYLKLYFNKTIGSRLLHGFIKSLVGFRRHYTQTDMHAHTPTE